MNFPLFVFSVFFLSAVAGKPSGVFAAASAVVSTQPTALSDGESEKNPNPHGKARLTLQKALKAYTGPAQIRLEQEIFLSSLKTSVKSQGLLKLKAGKFYMSLKGDPSSLMLFDGLTLWYQADTEENTVFKLPKSHPARILTGLLSAGRFFELFRIRESQKSGKEYVARLEAMRPIEGLNGIFMKIGSYISEIRLVWEDLDNWQKYSLSAPVKADLPEKHFRFDAKGFRVITEI